VIHTLKYGDSSLIAHCYTKRYGQQAYMLKGILKSRRKGLLQKSHFQPLTLLEIIAAPQPEDRLGFIKEAQVLYPFQKLPFAIHKSTLALFLSEILFEVLQEEPEANPVLFAFLKQSVIALDQEESIGAFHLLFLMQLSQFIGFYPLIENKEHPYFDLKNGSTTNKMPAQYYIEGPLKSLWVTLCGMKFDELSRFHISKSDKKKLLEQLLVYYQLHLQNFKLPKSISVLHEVFQ